MEMRCVTRYVSSLRNVPPHREDLERTVDTVANSPFPEGPCVLGLAGPAVPRQARGGNSQPEPGPARTLATP